LEPPTKPQAAVVISAIAISEMLAIARSLCVMVMDARVVKVDCQEGLPSSQSLLSDE